MNQFEFDELRKMPDKRIEGDILFLKTKDTKSYFFFEKVPILNQFKWSLYVNGKFWPNIPSYGFNFSIVDVGPICRLEVNSNNHGNSGRNHKHEFTKESDSRNNLPIALKREDFESLEILEGWKKICEEARIVHNGSLILPEAYEEGTYEM